MTNEEKLLLQIADARGQILALTQFCAALVASSDDERLRLIVRSLAKSAPVLPSDAAHAQVVCAGFQTAAACLLLGAETADQTALARATMSRREQ